MSSRNMYSEHGLLALMRPSAGQVCHSLIVVSYCTPGIGASPRRVGDLVPEPMAGQLRLPSPSVRRLSVHSPSLASTSKNSFGTRRLLFEFWPATVR